MHDMQKKKKFLNVFKRYERSELISKSKFFFFLKTIKAYFKIKQIFFKIKIKASITFFLYPPKV